MSLDYQLSLLHKRRDFLAANFPLINNSLTNVPDLRNSCPACGYIVFNERADDAICPLCHWQDDGQDNDTANEIWGGPNYDYSLAEYRVYFLTELGKARNKTVFRNDVDEKFTKSLQELAKTEELFFNKGSDKQDYMDAIGDVMTITHSSHFPHFFPLNKRKA